MESNISAQKRICLEPLESCMIENANQTQSWSQINAVWKQSPCFLRSLSNAFCKEELHPGKDPDCSQTLVTVVSPDLPACCVCLPRRVAWGSLHHACCPWRIFFSCVAGDILFENLLTFRITGFLLTLLLVLVEWEFSWKDEALFTLVIEWLWRRKGMGQKQGTSNCCHTHADKTTSL